MRPPFTPSDIVHFLQTISYVLGALYMAVTVIELLGIVAAVTVRFQSPPGFFFPFLSLGSINAPQRRITLVRLYAFLTILAGLLAVGAGLIRTIVQFAHKVSKSLLRNYNSGLVFIGDRGGVVRKI
jgi:hypothetical protein